MEQEKLTAPRIADFAVQNLNFYEQYYFRTGSEVNFLAKPRGHNGFLFLNGCNLAVHLISGEVIRAQTGDLLYLPKGCYYRLVFTDVIHSVPTVLFNFDMELEGEDFTLADSIVQIRTKNADALASVLEKARGAKGSLFLLKSCFYALLQLWLEESTHLSSVLTQKHMLLAPAMEYIAAHPDENISVFRLAQLCYVSESFFRKKFLEAYGVSPKAYCLQKRLEKAKMLLELGELNVSQVSDLLGFSSPPYFSRIFQKKFGKPPVAYLQK